MNKLILVILIAIIRLQSIAQNKSESTYFIELNSGEKIVGQVVNYKTSAFGKSHFEVDGIDYKYDQVQVYRNADGYYIKDSYGGYKPRFYKREMFGNHIETYVIISTTYNYNGGGVGGTPGMGAMQSSKYHYYKKDYGALKLMNYDNLKFDLNDNKESMITLNKIRTIRIVNASLIVTGAATMFYGISEMKKQDQANQDLPPGERDLSFHPGIFIGTALVIAPLFTKGVRIKKMEEAIRMYNK